MGVSGAQALFTALAKNQTLKHLNVFRNGLDVDGARSLGEALKTNCSLEFIDVGHNSIRHVGLTAIMNGVKANPKSALKKLSVRANFIKDDSFSLLFDEMVLGAKQQLTHLFIKNNFLTEYHKIALAKKVAEKKVNVYVDEFMTVDNLRKERVDTSIWMAPLPSK